MNKSEKGTYTTEKRVIKATKYINMQRLTDL